MSKKKKITLVYSDDWDGLYVGNRLLAQNNLLTCGEVLTILQEQGILTFEEIKIDDYYLYNELGGSLPELLTSVSRGKK